ncbi:hypothetical protein V2J09_014130 [Rumex salicifolius]
MHSSGEGSIPSFSEMVFSKIVDIITAAANSKPLRHSASIPYGLLSPSSYIHSFGLGNSGQMSNMRLSSSLQDFSTYRQLDLEDGEHLSVTDTIHAKHPHPLRRESAGANFFKEKAPLGSPILRKRWIRLIVVILLLILFAFLLFVLVQYYYTYWYGGASRFYVVLDCGSTGTRVYIYEALVNHNKNHNLPLVLRSYSEFRKKPKGQTGRAYDRMETEPGLDKLVHNGSGLKAAVKPLIRWAEEQIPKKSHRSTSLFLYATAGVRRLPSSDSAWLLDNVWPILRSSPFQCEREWIKTITGMEEAYYGWIALNYQTGILGAMPKMATFGALDLGGSSLQVTFETKKPAHKETDLNLSIGPVNHHLSAYSLSGYGLNDAFDKSVVRLLKMLPNIDTSKLLKGELEIKHPCLQTGYKEQYMCPNCALISQESGSPLHGVKSFGKGGKPGIPVRLTGAPNWEECSALANIAVNLSEWSSLSPGIDCQAHPCALSEDHPHPFGQFYAMSGFFVVYRFFNLTSEASLDDVLQKGHEFCDKLWEVAFKSVPPQPFIEQYCFRAPYVVSLLREGLHITDKQITIGSGSITWTLGVALFEAGKAFSTRSELQSYELLRMKIYPIYLLAILLILSILLLCVLSWVSKWLPRLFHRPSLPIFRHNNGSATSVLNISSPFRFQRWSPISSGDERVKMPLSPTAAEQVRSYGAVHRLSGNGIQHSETSMCSSSSSFLSSFTSGSIGHMQLDNNSMGPIWSPHRTQMQLQSRRSQSREDLNSSLAEAHMAKV